MIYLDSSALVKLVAEEPESDPLRAFLERHTGAVFLSSMLAHAEVLRAVRPAGSSALVAARTLLRSLYLIEVSRALLERAGMIDTGATLRTLDAIHVATAASVEERLTLLITYDDRMAWAARAIGLEVQTPVA